MTAGVDFDFDNSTLEVVFEASAQETSFELNDTIIFDDLLNEATEGFVMVLETDSDIDFIANREALRFDIFDNDG